MGRVNSVDPELLILHDKQADDGVEYGGVSDLCLRYLGRIYQLEIESKKLLAMVEHETDIDRTEPLTNIIDAIERELDIVVGFYTFQLTTELKTSWKGPPIFTIRAGSIAVIRQTEHRAHERHITHRPFRATNPLSYYRPIALKSVKELRELHK